MLPTPPGLTPCAPHPCSGKAWGREHLGTGAGWHLLDLELTPLGLSVKQGTPPGPDPHHEPILPWCESFLLLGNFGRKLSSLLLDRPLRIFHGLAMSQTRRLLSDTEAAYKAPAAQLRVLRLEGGPAGVQQHVPCRGHLLWTHWAEGQSYSHTDLHASFPIQEVRGGKPGDRLGSGAQQTCENVAALLWGSEGKSRLSSGPALPELLGVQSAHRNLCAWTQTTIRPLGGRWYG